MHCSADENVYTLDFLLSAPVPTKASVEGSRYKKMITENGESEEEDVDMENESNEGDWIGLSENDGN